MADEYQLELNSNEMCRNCLARNCQLNSLFRCDIIDGDVWPIPKVYKNVTDITIIQNDNFPQNICSKCELAMIQAFKFKQKSLKSHNLLRKILKIPHGDEVDVVLTPVLEKQRSHSIQITGDDIDDTDISVAEINDKENDNDNDNDNDTNVEQFKQEVSDYVEESEESEGVWQLVYVTNTENDDAGPLHDEQIRDDEIIEALEEEETQNQLTLNLMDTVDCEYCSEQVVEPLMKNHLQQHAKLMPLLLGSMDFFRCSRCLTAFPFIENFIKHVNADEGCQRSLEMNRMDACTNYQYLTNDPIIRLFSTSKNIDNNTFSCSLCIKDFLDLIEFQMHFAEEHLSSLDSHPEYFHTELTHLCGICDCVFKNLKDCLHHIYFHQPEYRCIENDCDHVSSTFSLLYFHMMKCGHSQQAHTFECAHCTYDAKNDVDLKEHQRTNCPARNIKCDVCDKSFFKKSTLTIHMRSHTNERRYPCKYCEKAFLQHNDLANHIRTHTLERPFKCKLCDARFKTVGQRIGHMSTHETENNFECNVCQKKFKSSRILRGHMRVHGERQFKCEQCGKNFNRRYHLTLHMKRHDKPTATKTASKMKKIV